VYSALSGATYWSLASIVSENAASPGMKLRTYRKRAQLRRAAPSRDAKEYVAHIDPRVVLIDGRQLAEYLLDLGF
jgi:restriction endonuclease Mrr